MVKKLLNRFYFDQIWETWNNRSIRTVLELALGKEMDESWTWRKNNLELIFKKLSFVNVFFQMIVCGKYLLSWLDFINFVGVSTLYERKFVNIININISSYSKYWNDMLKVSLNSTDFASTEVKSFLIQKFRFPSKR